MPYKEKEIAKIYWNIGEVAKIVHRDTSAIRFWESEFYWLKVKKGKLGHRQYTKGVLNQILQINFALSFVGLTSDGVKKAYTMGYLESLLGYVAELQRDFKEISPNNYQSKYLKTIAEAFGV